MKTEEDEAFDEIARKQGMWGGGFMAKRAMAADKQKPWNEDEWRRNNWRCHHGWLRGEQCEICNAAQEPVCLACKAEVLYECVACSSNNYPPLPVQEPVAWITPDGEGFRIRFSAPTNDVPLGWDALYTTPPKREWVGLTDDELADLWYKESLDWMEFGRAADAKLKEKNT